MHAAAIRLGDVTQVDGQISCGCVHTSYNEMPGGIRPGNLRFSPYWDPLRKDPRFETLLKNPPPVSY